MKRSNNKTTVRAFSGYTPFNNPAIGSVVDDVLAYHFNDSIELPYQELIGHVLKALYKRGAVYKLLPNGFDTDALFAERENHEYIESTIDTINDYLVGYGSIRKTTTKTKDKKTGEYNYNVRYSFIIERDALALFEVKERKKEFPSLKKLKKARVQTELSDNIGIKTKVEGLDKLYLELLSKQYVTFTANLEEAEKVLESHYSTTKRNFEGEVVSIETETTAEKVERHIEALKRLDGSQVPLRERLEPRGRAAAQEDLFLGFNFYGKSWETKSFHLSEEDVAYDARQSGYQILGSLLGIKPMLELTGAYDNGTFNDEKDIYTKAFGEVLSEVFGKDVERSIAKRPAQMLAYMAGMKTILTRKEEGQKSIIETLAPEALENSELMKEYTDALEAAFKKHPVLGPVMDLREEVRDGQFKNMAVPNWKFDEGMELETSNYFFSRTSTNFISEAGTNHTPRYYLDTDLKDKEGKTKRSQISMHTIAFRAQAKSSAILSAIIHSLDAYIKKQVSLDVWAAGGKILVKHDEFIVDKAHEDVLHASYHKWLAHVGRNPKRYLEEPLKSCGYKVDVEALRARNERVLGKVDYALVASSKNGLKYEWTNTL